MHARTYSIVWPAAGAGAATDPEEAAGAPERAAKADHSPAGGAVSASCAGTVCSRQPLRRHGRSHVLRGKSRHRVPPGERRVEHAGTKPFGSASLWHAREVMKPRRRSSADMSRAACPPARPAGRQPWFVAAAVSSELARAGAAAEAAACSVLSEPARSRSVNVSAAACAAAA